LALVAIALAAAAAARSAPAAAGAARSPGPQELHPCEPYCSLGAVRPFYGDISSSARPAPRPRAQRAAAACPRPAARAPPRPGHSHPLGNPLPPGLAPRPKGGGLRAALAARSHRGEVILMISEARRLDVNLNAWYSLRALGMGHVLFVSTDPAACRAVRGQRREGARGRVGGLGRGLRGGDGSGARGGAGSELRRMALASAHRLPARMSPPMP
jgi:hypothetical protein